MKRLGSLLPRGPSINWGLDTNHWIALHIWARFFTMSFEFKIYFTHEFYTLRCASMALNPWFSAWGGKEKKNTRWLYRWYFTSTGLSETVLDFFTFISACFSLNHFTKALGLHRLKKAFSGFPIPTKPTSQLSTPCTNNFISSPIQISSSEIWISFAPAWITSALAGPGRCVVGYWPGLTIRPRPAANPCNLHPTTPYSFHTTLFPIVPSSYDHVYLCF